MKKMTSLFVSVVAMAVSSIAAATEPGTYVGGGLGLARINTPNSMAFDISGGTGQTSRNLGGLGGRLFAGYNINNYLGLEAGYTLYPSSKYKGSYNGANASLKYNMSALDLLAKAYLPVADTGLDVYALAGVALVNSNVKYSNNGVPLASGYAAPELGSHTVRKVRPEVGVGVKYAVTKNVSTALELTHIQGTGNVKSSSRNIADANMAAITVSYNFG